MNHPLDHRGYTFYQSNYIRVRDPHTGQSTGQFQSVFQVATNPGRPIIYAGCLLVVLGISFSSTCGRGSSPTAARRERERAPAPPGRKPSWASRPKTLASANAGREALPGHRPAELHSRITNR